MLDGDERYIYRIEIRQMADAVYEYRYEREMGSEKHRDGIERVIIHLIYDLPQSIFYTGIYVYCVMSFGSIYTRLEVHFEV